MPLTSEEITTLTNLVTTILTPQIVAINNRIDKLNEVYELMGLDPAKPLTVTQTSRSAGSLTQEILVDDLTKITTVTRL